MDIQRPRKVNVLLQVLKQQLEEYQQLRPAQPHHADQDVSGHNHLICDRCQQPVDEDFFQQTLERLKVGCF